MTRRMSEKLLLNDPDALVGPILFAIDEKLVVTFE